MSLALLHSAADIVGQLLIDLNAGTLAGNWPVKIDDEPNTPDNAITVYDTTPKSHGRSMIDGEGFCHYGVQIRIRAVNHPIGFVKANAIQVLIEEGLYQETVTIDGTSYFVHCMSVTSLLRLGKETPTSTRRLFTVNAIVPIRRLT